MNDYVRVERRDAPSAPTGRRRLGVAALLLAGAAITLFGSSPASESERSAVTAPDVPPPEPSQTADASIAPAVVAAPLDQRVPGFEGTLVVTMATGAGTEVWRWSTGPGGAVIRSVPVADVADARPDPTGTWVVGIRSVGGAVRLEAALETSPVPIFWGADSFAWDRTGDGRIGWAESSDDGTIGLHTGRHIDTGVGFTPAGRYEPEDPTASHRMVGIDGLGFIVERIDTARNASVHRIALDGTELASVDGFFVGSSPGGRIAVAGSTATRIFTGALLEPGATIERSLTSAAWSDDGRRLAVAHLADSTVDIIDGASRSSIEVGSISPRILSWDAIGRFVIIAGDAGTDGIESVLVFIDAATLDVRSISVAASPVGAVVAPRTTSQVQEESVR